MKSKLTLITVAALVLVAGCAILFQLYTKRCLWWDCAPTRSFELSELNIPADYFPENADVGQLHQLNEYSGAIVAEAEEYTWNFGDMLANRNNPAFTEFLVLLRAESITNPYNYDAYWLHGLMLHNPVQLALAKEKIYSLMTNLDWDISSYEEIRGMELEGPGFGVGE